MSIMIVPSRRAMLVSRSLSVVSVDTVASAASASGQIDVTCAQIKAHIDSD